MEWLGDHLWEAWLIVAAGLAALELVSLDLILLMLAGGAVVGSVTAAVGGGFALSLVLALVTAVGLLAVVRPGVVHRLHGGPTLRTGAEALVGRRATVLSPVGHDAPGRIKLAGEEWSALPYDEDDHLEPGTPVDVVAIKGATAYVLRIHPLEA